VERVFWAVKQSGREGGKEEQLLISEKSPLKFLTRLAERAHLGRSTPGDPIYLTGLAAEAATIHQSGILSLSTITILSREEESIRAPVPRSGGGPREKGCAEHIRAS